MALATLITLTDIQLAYGHHPLLDHADFSIQAGERIGLIGRNGAGKSSLLRLLDGRTLPDDGDIARSSGLRVTTVEQEPELDENATVFDVVCNTEGEHEDWQRPSRVRAVLEKLGLPADAQIAGLSGGTRKRVALARALVDEPDLLLLDEPTNHLDFDGIAWLEDMLRNWKGAAVIITHDRRFLDAVATRIVELDRGRLLSFPAISRNGRSARPNGWNPSASNRRASTSCWPRRKCGSARAWRPAAPATKAACVGSSACESNAPSAASAWATSRSHWPKASAPASSSPNSNTSASASATRPWWTTTRPPSCVATASASSAPTAPARPRC